MRGSFGSGGRLEGFSAEVDMARSAVAINAAIGNDGYLILAGQSIVSRRGAEGAELEGKAHEATWIARIWQSLL
jgi:hypothetical protein